MHSKTELLEFLHTYSCCECSREGADMAVLPLEQLCLLLSHCVSTLREFICNAAVSRKLL